MYWAPYREAVLHLSTIHLVFSRKPVFIIYFVRLASVFREAIVVQLLRTVHDLY